MAERGVRALRRLRRVNEHPALTKGRRRSYLPKEADGGCRAIIAGGVGKKSRYDGVQIATTVGLSRDIEDRANANHLVTFDEPTVAAMCDVIAAAVEAWGDQCQRHATTEAPLRYVAPYGALAKIGAALERLDGVVGGASRCR